MSNLVDHAKRELDLVESDQWMKEGLIKVVATFAEMGHSGGSASYAIGVLDKLLQFKNLSPLTDDPDEWMHVAGDIWQSRRDSEAFSNDEGKTYYLLAEGASDKNREPLHKTEHKE